MKQLNYILLGFLLLNTIQYSNACSFENRFSNYHQLDFGNQVDQSYYEFTEPVLKNLLKAMGKTDVSVPLKIIYSDKEVAFINSKGIHVSTKFIDVCKSMGDEGDDALAYVLAHELGHQEKDHFFALKFGSAYASSEWGAKIENSFEDIKQMGIWETEADEFGLFFSYSAGYNTLDIADKVIDKVYEAFDLPDEMPGYPPKSFRKEQAVLARAKVDQLIPVFEIGNFLNLLAGSKKEDAQRNLLRSSRKCYDHLLAEKVSTIETYNNLGVSYLNEALSMKRFLFALPTELDFYSRMYIRSASGTGAGPGGGTKPPVPPIDPFQNAIEQSIRYFEKCIQIDRNYIAAYNNLAAANILWKEYDEAYAKARKAQRLAKKIGDKIAERNAIDILALVHFFLEEEEESLEYLELSKTLNSTVYPINIEFVKGYRNAGLGFDPVRTAEVETHPERYFEPDFKDMETLYGEYLSDIAYDMFDREGQDELWYLGIDKAEIAKKDVNGHDLYVYANLSSRGRSQYYAFYYVENDKAMKTGLDITIGNNSEDVVAKYQEPAKVISGNQQDYWVYFHHNIIFKFDQEGKVIGWIIYDIG